MANPKIPIEVLGPTEDIIYRIARKHGRSILVRHRGPYLYVGSWTRNHPARQFWPLCRLEYLGSKDRWGFAIYKYSNERYTDDEPFFPPEGTVEELIEVAFAAYPS